MKYILFIITSITLFSCKELQKNTPEQPVKDTLILNEEFESNKLGWTEEDTDYHYTEIKESKLFIHSKDTTATQSSNGPRNISFLFNLPKAYEITTLINPEINAKEMRYGIILYSASLYYKFALSDSGIVKVTEYDYNRKSEEKLLSKIIVSYENKNNSPNLFKLNVSGKKFGFYIDDKLIGSGSFKTKGWEMIRLFTSSGSAISCDYLKIKELK